IEHRSYCLLHFPGKDKIEEFNTLIQTKLTESDYDFSGCWFPEVVDFVNYHFAVDVKFRDAVFTNGANFAGSQFDGSADFNDCEFCADEHSENAVKVNFE